MGAGLAHESPTDTFKHHEYLWGWKVIACFLNLSVRTAQRWEHEAKLPVHRLHTGRKAFPYAMESELSGWIKERTASRQSPPQVDKRLPPLMQSFLDSMTAPIAVLDARGTIIAVNKAWRVFSSANGYRDSDLGIGRNYFEVCGSAACVDAATASRVAEGLAEFLAGKRPDLKVKYRCDRPTEKRDFLLSATRFEGLTSPFLVLSHSDVTNVL
jgi:nitrogen fixation/metabolism regulation signal transduction histidine kinase